MSLEDVDLSEREVTFSSGLSEEEIEEKLEEIEVESSLFGIFLICMTLLAGQLIKHCSHRYHVPYTPVLTVLGVILGVVDKLVLSEDIKLEEEANEAGFYAMTLFGIHNPEPHLVLHIFLPALIFESAFNSDWYTFKR